jgi:hypothetical protein
MEFVQYEQESEQKVEFNLSAERGREPLSRERYLNEVFTRRERENKDKTTKVYWEDPDLIPNATGTAEFKLGGSNSDHQRKVVFEFTVDTVDRHFTPEELTRSLPACRLNADGNRPASCDPTNSEIRRVLKGDPFTTERIYPSKEVNLIIKPYAEIVSTSEGGVALSWDGLDDIPKSEGAELLVYTSREAKQKNPDKPLRHYCLGGAQPQSVGVGKNYNLWLRGALDSDGDGNSDLSDCRTGNRIHTLPVPQGAFVVAKAAIAVHGGSATVNVTFDVWWQDAKAKTVKVKATTACNSPVSISPADSQPVCPPTFQACGFPVEGAVNECGTLATLNPNARHVVVSPEHRARMAEVITSPVCDNSDGTAWPVGDDAAILHQHAVSGVLCEGQAINPGMLPDDISPGEGRIWCGWEPLSTPQTVDLPGTQCPSLVRQETVLCPRVGDEASFSQILNQCANAAQVVASTNARLQTLRDAQPPQFPSLTNPLTLDQFTPVDPEEREILVPGSFAWVRDEATGHTVPVPQSAVLTGWAKKSSRSPAFDDFSHENRGTGPRPPSFEHSLQQTASREESIRDVFPFSGNPETAMYPDQRCALIDAATPEGQRALREYAAQKYQELQNREVEFKATSAPAEDLVESSTVCARAEQIRTSACGDIIVSPDSGATCGEPQFLGVYDRNEFPQGPQECQTGLFSRCVSKSIDDGTTVEEQRALIEARAKALAFRELRRYFPAVAANCGDAGCAQVEIDSSDSQNVRVTSTVGVPLTFPLDSLWQRDKAAVTSSVTAFDENRLITTRPAS